MLNLKTKSMLMGATSFLMAFLVLTVLTVVNEKTKDGLSFLKTTIAEQTVSLGVCSQFKNVSTGGTCDVTDSEAFTATAGTYDLYADIERGPADQTEESFELSLNGVSIGTFMDDGKDGITTKVLLKSGVSILASNTLLMTHLAPNSDVTKPNSVSISKIYLENNATEPVVSSASCTATASLANITSASETSYITWTATNAVSMKAECTGPVATGNIDWYVDQATSPFPSGYPAHFDAGMVGTEVCTFTPYDSTEIAGTPCSTTINVNVPAVTAYSCTGTTPTNATLCSGDDVSLTSNTEKSLKSACTDAVKCEYVCSTGYSYDSSTKTCAKNNGNDTCTITFTDSTGATVTNLTPGSAGKMKWTASIGSSIATYYECYYGDDYTNTKIGGQVTGSSGEVSLSNLSSSKTSAYYCVMSLFDGSSSVPLNKNADWGATCGGALNVGSSTYSCSGTVPSNASLCSSDSTGLTANTTITLKSACTDAVKCEYTCSSDYAYDSTTKTCVASTNGSCGTASKTYSSSSTSYGTDTFCVSGTASPTSPAFPASGSSTSWSCVGSNGGTTADCKATLSSVITNGACGSANGTTIALAPTSNLCSAGNASSVSGSGPWTWTCSGINGGTNISCSANLLIPTSTYTYSPTTSVIPVTEYTYSYTSKVAPTSGPATNVALLLSISAVVTLGVWMAVKKIKG